MQVYTADRLRATLSRLRRNPVLIAMMSTLLLFGVTASIAGIAMWRTDSACLAQAAVTEISDFVPARKVDSATCPCAATAWHWQRI